MSKESLTNQPEEPVPPLARDSHFKLTSRLPPFALKRKKNHAGPAGYWWMCRYSTPIWMLRLLINPACSNATQWLICIQMKYNVSRKTLFISVQSIHFFRLLNWEGIQLSYVNNLQSSDIPKEFEAHLCCIEIVFHFALISRLCIKDWIRETDCSKKENEYT